MTEPALMSDQPVRGVQAWPADRVERRAVASLIPYAKNARTHSAQQVAQIAASIGLRDKQPDGPKEKAEQAQFDSDQGYKAALISTLKRTRELVAEGRLST